MTATRFSNRRTPPTDADFACPPGINPGRRLPDWCYMDDDVAPPQAPPKPRDPSNDNFDDEFQ